MAWIESHQQLERHPKVYELMGLMGWDLDTTIGKLHRFWWWCLDYASTGDLRGKNDAVLAGSVGLATTDGKRFVEAMVQSCWIDRADGVFRVHDWIDYAGRYLKESKFKNHPEKVRELESLYRPRIIRGQSKVPNQPTNQPNQPEPPAAADGGKPPDKTAAAYRQFTDYFCRSWSKAHGGEDYGFGKSDGAVAAVLWAELDKDLTKAKRVIDGYLADTSDFYRGHKLSKLKSDWRRFLAATNGRHTPRPAAVPAGREDY